MSKLIIEVCRISEVINHPGADRLDIIKLKGWSCIVGRNQYHSGELVIYCPPDSIIPPDIIEKYKLEFLKKNGKVGSIKLRGELSQGLILDCQCDNVFEGQDVAAELGITKYEPPEPEYSLKTGQIAKKNKHNPNFEKYTDIENINNFNKVFEEGEEVVITEKIHGCLQSDTSILLSDGNTKTIREIVETKYNGYAIGKNNRGELVPSKIIKWFDNGKTINWLSVNFERPGQRGNKYFSVKCTSNHKFYLPRQDKYLMAKDLINGDYVQCAYSSIKMPYTIEQILIGKMLGDGSFQNQSIVFGHKKEHKEYVDYTLKSLGYFGGNYQNPCISGFGTEMIRARTISCECIADLFEEWFITHKKQVPNDIKLSPISLAFWYMDDGSLSHHESQEDRALISTNGFNENSINYLLNALLNLGIRAIKYKSNGWRIRFNKDEAEKLFSLVYPYIPNCMQYKLPEKYRRNCPVEFPKTEVKTIIKTNIKKIINISIYKNSNKINHTRYDIETETHNYFANNCLVHNCNFRAGNLPITPLNLWDWIRWLFGQRYEFVYGSRGVQKKWTNIHKGFYKEDVWGKIVNRYNMKEWMPKDYTIYGEIYGAGIQDLTYGLVGEISFAVFDVKYKDRYLNWDEYIEFTNKYLIPNNIEIVPILFIGEYTESLRKQLTNRQSLICSGQIAEGCVIKPKIERTNRCVGRVILKSINPDYLTRKSGTEFK